MFKFIEMEEAGCAQLGGEVSVVVGQLGKLENGRLKNTRCFFFFGGGGSSRSTNKSTGRINIK